MSKKYVADSFVKNGGTAQQVLMADGSTIPIPSGGTKDFVATGTIGSGDVVGLRSDGTVEAIANEVRATTLGNIGSEFFRNLPITLYNPSNGYCLVFQKYSSSDTRYLRTVTASTDPPSYLTSVNLAADIIYEAFYAADVEKIVVFQTDSTFYEQVDVYDATPASITLETTGYAPLSGPDDSVVGVDMEVEPSGYLVVAGEYDFGNSLSLMTGNAVTPGVFGGQTTLMLINTFSTKIVYNIAANVYIITYRDTANGNAVYARTITRTGLTLSAGTPFALGGSTTNKLVYDATREKILHIQDNLIQTLEITGTTLSVLDVSNPTMVLPYYYQATYHKDTETLVLTGNGTQDSTAKYYAVTWDGASYIATAHVEYYGTLIEYNSIIYDPINLTYVTFWEEGSFVKRALLTLGGDITTNAKSTIGIANAAIADTATGEVVILGGVNSNQSSLVPGELYYVDYQGNIVTNPNTGYAYKEIGTAISTTEILVKPKTVI